nr:hypothetical protein [Tanacetum cinerariifolium]
MDEPLKTQVTALVDEHLDARLVATRDEFMNFLLTSITARITQQVKNQLPQIMPNEVSNFAPSMIQSMVTESLDHAILAKEDKDKDEDPSVGSDRWLKKRKTSKDLEPTKGPKAKESQTRASKGAQSQLKSFVKSIQSKELEFEVADSDIPQDQEENPGNNDEEPKGKNDKKTPQQGPTQSWLMTLASSADKPSKTFDELMSTPIDCFAYIRNGLNITNLTQETLLGPAFRLLKGTRTNYAELEYDFEECYKALLEKLNWENPERDDYPFDLTKPLPLVRNENCQMVSVDYFFNNDLKHLRHGSKNLNLVKVSHDKHVLCGISYWRDQLTWVQIMRKYGYGYLKEIKVRRANNDLYTFKEGDFLRLRINDIEDMLLLVVQNRLTNILGDDVSNIAIDLRMFTRSIVIQKRVEDLQLAVKSYQKNINITKLETTKLGIRKKDPL